MFVSTSKEKCIKGRSVIKAWAEIFEKNDLLGNTEDLYFNLKEMETGISVIYIARAYPEIIPSLEGGSSCSQ